MFMRNQELNNKILTNVKKTLRIILWWKYFDFFEEIGNKI